MKGRGVWQPLAPVYGMYLIFAVPVALVLASDGAEDDEWEEGVGGEEGERLVSGAREEDERMEEPPPYRSTSEEDGVQRRELNDAAVTKVQSGV